MSDIGSEYAIAAYVIALGLLWGYAAVLWIAARRQKALPAPVRVEEQRGQR